MIGPLSLPHWNIESSGIKSTPTPTFKKTMVIIISVHLASNLTNNLSGIIVNEKTVVGIFGLILTSYITDRRWSLKSIEINRLSGYLSAKADLDKIMGYGLLAGAWCLFSEKAKLLWSAATLFSLTQVNNRIGIALGFSVTNCQLVEWLMYLIMLPLPLLISNVRIGKASIGGLNFSTW